ncbi:MAG: hypothetical protein KJ070_14255 [Verrucomicrobia bacterium]|nr:hypothetical protein [Verrucomicrobiota bacterium]
MIESLANRGNARELLRAYVAIHTAASLPEPLTDDDLDNALNEIDLAEQHLSKADDFAEILSLRKELAELSWLGRQKEILESKLEHQANPYSYRAGVYTLEKSCKRPINRTQKEQIRELAEAVAKSEKELADYLDKRASEEAFDKWLKETVAKVAAEEGTNYSRN